MWKNHNEIVLEKNSPICLFDNVILKNVKHFRLNHRTDEI